MAADYDVRDADKWSSKINSREMAMDIATLKLAKKISLAKVTINEMRGSKRSVFSYLARAFIALYK